MWLLGLVLLVLGLILGLAVLFWIGVVLLVVGLLVFLIPSRADSRRWYW